MQFKAGGLILHFSNIVCLIRTRGKSTIRNCVGGPVFFVVINNRWTGLIG